MKTKTLFSYLVMSCFLAACAWGSEGNCECESENSWGSEKDWAWVQAQEDNCGAYACNKDCDDVLPPSPDMLSRYYREIGDCYRGSRCGNKCGVWLPDDPPLFRPFVADPRQVCYSAGWRFDDQALNKNVVDVSFGDILPIYQWWSVWPWGGELRVEFEGCLWAVFAPLQYSAPLINADYYVCIPITYAFDRWAFRVRFFHISSHVGDEFLINHFKKTFKGKPFKRRNPSAEYLDFFAAYDVTDDIRVYGGAGVVCEQDPSFPIGKWYAEGGFELHLRELGYFDPCNRIFGMPYLATHLWYRHDFKHHLDQTYVLGYEWGKTCGLCQIVRVFVEYHDGYSAEGQFSRFATNYFAIRASYGY